MARWTTAKALWLLTVVHQTLALSAHSPRDLEAFPAYSVILSQSPVLNETATELLAEGAQLGNDAHSPKRHLLRSPSGQAFLCTVPVIQEERKVVEAQAEKDALVQATEREQGLVNGLALLEPLRNGCLYLHEGWFTYSFCYGAEIRQFHAIRVAGAIGPTEDPDSDAYSLGVMPEAQVVVQTPKYGSGSAAALQQERIPARLGAEASQGFGWDEGGRYLSQTWASGTVCDKTGLPREVEVQFHCSTQSTDRIAWIRETSICRYVMLIHTPRLCGEPVFLEGRRTDASTAAAIECQPVVRQMPGEDELQKAAASAAGPDVISGFTETSQGSDQQLYLEGVENGATGQQLPHQAGSHEHEQLPHQAGSHKHEHKHNLPQKSTFDSEHDHDHYHDGQEVVYDEEETMLTLVYDPETGEIESAVTDTGEDVFLDSALRKLLFGEDDGHTEHAPTGSDSQDEAHVDIGSDFGDLRQIIHDSISDALRQYAHGQQAPAATDAEPAQADQPAREPPLLHQPLDDVVQALLAAVRDPQDTISREQQQAATDRQTAEKRPKLQPGLHKYLQQFDRERQTVQVPPKAVLGNDEHEQLKRRFARRYEAASDDEKDEEQPRVRDEL